MNAETLKKYVGYTVFLSLKNGFRYKFLLKEEYVNGDKLSFTGKFGEPIDLDISEITFITIADEGDRR